jgi:hypothetical protein
MMSIVKLVAISLLALSLFQSGQEPAETIPRDQQIDGSVSTIADDIRVDGVVAGDVVSWTGNIVVSGHVYGDVVSYTGNVTILPGARVDGSAMSLNGALQIEQATLGGSAIKGSGDGRIFSRIVGVFAPEAQAPLGAANAANWLFSLFLGAVVLSSALLLMSSVPNRLAAAAAMLRSYPSRALVVGMFAAIALMTLAFVLAGMLATTIIGLPLSVLLLLLLHVPFVFGVATLFQAASATFDPQAQGISLKTGLTALALVLPLLLIGLIAPFAALLLCYALASPGLGAAILSRGGMLREA